MSGLSLTEQRLIVKPAVAAHRDDDAQPHVAEHPHRLGVVLAALSGTPVVCLGPLTLSHAGKGELPQGVPQGTNAGAAKVNRAGGTAGPGDGGGTRFALGDAGLAIPVAIIAQFSDHP